MSIILNIETSSKNCSVSLSSKGELLSNLDYEDEKFVHSEFLTSSIKKILNKHKFKVKDLSAVSIGVGPGSFTGLRIGFSVAKGLCYPHKINLIGIPSLKVLANSVNNGEEDIISLINDKGNYYYMSKFNDKLKEIIPANIELIDDNFFKKNFIDNSLLVVNSDNSYRYLKNFLGTNKKLIKSKVSSLHMSNLSQNEFNKQNFMDLAYAEPSYVKKPYVN